METGISLKTNGVVDNSPRIRGEDCLLLLNPLKAGLRSLLNLFVLINV